MSFFKQWLGQKPIQWSILQEELASSLELNQMTNGGPAVRKLEEELQRRLGLDAREKQVIAVCNGTAALHALVEAVHLQKGKRIKWATQSFTFPASAQGPLASLCSIVDIVSAELPGPDLSLVPPDVEGIIVTNCFGCVVPLESYILWQQEREGRVLLLDNAATCFTAWRGSNVNAYGAGSIISLHHTKPAGFGEAGAVVCDVALAPYVRQVINFGYDLVKLTQLWRPEGSNYKLSDISAAGVLQYWRALPLERLLEHHRWLYKELSRRISEKKLYQEAGVKMFADAGCDTCPNCLPLVFSRPLFLAQVPPQWAARKYYKPLDLFHPQANDLYQRVLCLPCNEGVGLQDLDALEEWLEKLT